MLRNRIRPPAVVPRTPRRRRALPASFVHRDPAAPHRRRLPRARCRRRVPPESLAPRRRRRLQSHRPCTETLLHLGVGLPCCKAFQDSPAGGQHRRRRPRGVIIFVCVLL